ncbi:hypothetical protein HAX54_032927, partial [Datura stramonium]|nr:hypothetical protein [Datura stramonium]
MPQVNLSCPMMPRGDSAHVSPCVIKSPKKEGNWFQECPLGAGLRYFLQLALGYVFLRLQKKKKNACQSHVSLVKGHERISYYELEQAMHDSRKQLA